MFVPVLLVVLVLLAILLCLQTSSAGSDGHKLH